MKEGLHLENLLFCHLNEAHDVCEILNGSLKGSRFSAGHILFLASKRLKCSGFVE